MKDDIGIYYYPVPQHPETRMYVRRFAGRIEFRMWNRDDSQVWERHGWLSHDVIEQAAALYRQGGKEGDPATLYDAAVAERLLTDE